MSKLTSERFLEMVAKSNLVEKPAYDSFVAKIKEKYGDKLPENPKHLAAAFVKRGMLTDWHVEKLLAGKYKGFFLGRYKLLGHIGTGGMSSVYLAEHTRMHDKRAIKVLPQKRLNDASYLARFQLEAKAIASLNHPNIVLAHDIDNEGDVHYIVMEYVDGLDLQTLVKRDGPMDISTAAKVISQAALGLQHAHSKGVIHRDVKPANLLIDSDGTVRLLDMGLALVAEAGGAEEASLTVAHNENVLGTADYLAPEQALNSHTVDHRADIYGLGCTLYFLLTGKPPFSDGTLAQRIARHQTEMPKSIRKTRSECPGELEGICVKMIQKDPAYRYQTAGEVAEILARFAAKVPKGETVRAGLGEGFPDDDSSSISFGTDERSPSSIRGDTVSAKNDDTLASSRSKLLKGEGLSPSDSGRLVAVQQKGTPSDLLDGSFLDLEIESGYRGVSKIHEKRASQGKGSQGKGSGTPSPAAEAGEKKGARGEDEDRAIRRDFRDRVSRESRKGIDPILVGTLLATLFIVAITIGYFLARLTS